MWTANDCSKPGVTSGGRFNGPLDLRAPEDQFSSTDQVEKRYRRPLSAPELQSTIAAFMRAWSEGDAESTRVAAKDLVDGTRAHFQSQGVPAFAHPIVPPEFAGLIAEKLLGLPEYFRTNALRSLLAAFEEGERGSVEHEVSIAMSASGDRPDDMKRAGEHGCGCGACAGKRDAMNRYDWK